MKKLIQYALIGAISSSLLSCEPKIEVPTPSKGGADFTKYVSYGNSLTIGFADNGLYNSGMKVAYPALIAQQLKKVGGGNFVTPLFDDAQENGTGYLRLVGFLPGGSPDLRPVTDKLAITGFDAQRHPVVNPNGVRLATYSGAMFNNFGIPSIRVSDLFNSNYHLVNPFLYRLYTDDERATGKSYTQKATELSPTFFTAWLGNNDALGYAASGGAIPLTPPDAFATSLTGFINSVTGSGAKGAIANIPDVSSIPYMTTVGPRIRQTLSASPTPAVVVSGSSYQASTFQVLPANKIWAPGAGGNAYFTLTFSTHAPRLGTQNYSAALKEAFNSIRAVNPSLTFSDFYASTGYDTTQAFGSVLNPIPHTFVLDSLESANLADHIRQYNDVISNLASSKNLALVDANSILRSFTTGRVFDGIGVSSEFIRGGLFSLDGVHLTPRGNAITANEFIKAINAKYGCSIPTLNVGDFKGVQFP